MQDRHNHTLSMMAELFGKIPSGDPGFFTIRRLDMKGRKVEISSPAINSPIHCFFYLSHGEAMISAGKELYFFRPGECCVIPEGQVFSIRYFDNCAGYMGGFSSDFLCTNAQSPLCFASLRRWGYHKVTFTQRIVPNIHGLLERICMENETSGNHKIIKAYLTTLFTEIEEAMENGAETSDNVVCNRFLELVFETFSRNNPLGWFASEMNISEEHLRKTVKRCTGKGPLEWINEARLLETKSLLFNTGMSVGEISRRVGIEDPAYFSRLFRKNTGMTPTQYRAARKKSNTSTE